MTDEELNEAVAKKVGDSKWQESGSGGVAAYATSLEIAWLLVERKGLSWNIFKYSSGSYGAVCHGASVSGDGEDKTAARAICKAFLALPEALP